MMFPINLRLACNTFAAQAGLASVETILARQQAGIVRIPTSQDRAPIRKPKAHPLFFAGKKDD
jgi:hypothetical protein